MEAFKRGFDFYNRWVSGAESAREMAKYILSPGCGIEDLEFVFDSPRHAVPVFRALEKTTPIKRLTYKEDPNGNSSSASEIVAMVGKMLTRNTGLRGLAVYVQETEDGVDDRPLVEALKVNTTIEELAVNWAPDLSAVLRVNTALHLLDLTSYRFRGPLKPMGREYICSLTESLAENRTLRVLRLDCNNLSEARDLFESLRGNTTLKELHIHGCDARADDITPMLQANRGLRVLNLSCNRFSAEEYAKFADVLAHHPLLQHISMPSHGDNRHSPRSYKSVSQTLARIVRQSRTLRTIDTSSVRPGDEEAHELMAAIRSNPVIEDFCVDVHWRLYMGTHMRQNHSRRLRRQVRGVLRAAWLLLAARKATLEPGGPAFKRARISFEAAAEAQRPLS